MEYLNFGVIDIGLRPMKLTDIIDRKEEIQSSLSLHYERATVSIVVVRTS